MNKIPPQWSETLKQALSHRSTSKVESHIMRFTVYVLTLSLVGVKEPNMTLLREVYFSLAENHVKQDDHPKSQAEKL